MLLVFLLNIVLRRRALVVAVVVVLMSIVAIAGNGFTLTTAIGLVVILITAIIVVRFGLLAFVVMSFMLPLLDHTPLTFDPASGTRGSRGWRWRSAPGWRCSACGRPSPAGRCSHRPAGRLAQGCWKGPIP